MRLLVRWSLVALGIALCGTAAAEPHKMRIKIDSQPQQAAIYINAKEAGIKGYTPTTLRLERGTYKVILELPGFRTIEKPLVVTRSEGFVFTMERQSKPALLDVRAAGSNDAANGAQLIIDGQAIGTVPARLEVPAGRHSIRVSKPGYVDYSDSADVGEGDQRQMVIDLQQAVKKGSLLVTSDVPGADVYVDGQKRDTAPALVSDLPEGQHSVEVRKDPLSWKQIVSVVGNQQLKVQAQLQPAAPPSGALRIVCSQPGAEVWIDGEMKGVVNSSIPDVPVGQHVVEVRARGMATQSLEVTIAAGEQRVARVDLGPGTPQPPQGARLRVVASAPNAEVFIDGASAGPAPIDRNDLAPGKHFVVVRARGFAEWKREIDLDPTRPETLSADLSSAGRVKIVSNVSGATVFIDGAVVGKTPLLLESFPAGEHFVEIKQPGFVDARQPFHLDGGDQKELVAELAPLHHGPTREDMARRQRAMTSFSAVTLDPARFTADLAGGYVPFGQVRLTVGAFRYNRWLGMDAGIELRTIGYFTEGGAHAKLQFIQAGPVAIGFDTFIGGGGGPTHRNDFIFEAGIPISLLFGDIVRFTAHPYLQVYSDKNCPTYGDLKSDAESAGKAIEASGTYNAERTACKVRDGQPGANGQMLMPDSNPSDQPLPSVTQDPRTRFVGARLMLQAVLELAVSDTINIFAIFEGDPVGQRMALTSKYSPVFPSQDSQIYGRAGVSFKF